MPESQVLSTVVYIKQVEQEAMKCVADKVKNLFSGLDEETINTAKDFKSAAFQYKKEHPIAGSSDNDEIEKIHQEMFRPIREKYYGSIREAKTLITREQRKIEKADKLCADATKSAKSSFADPTILSHLQRIHKTLDSLERMESLCIYDSESFTQRLADGKANILDARICKWEDVENCNYIGLPQYFMKFMPKAPTASESVTTVSDETGQKPKLSFGEIKSIIENL